ncbi:beta-N-acetylhexosaminidase [Laceyella putida]|uniref:Beta-N-acetylhexosaminidase n=1 Tax=Laceyella putida TaxID=110101 RepID=A0ABW2RJS1_9BACL
MYRNRWRGWALALTSLLIVTQAGCSTPWQSKPKPGAKWVDEKIKQMSLDEKIGQMFIMGFRGETSEQAFTVNAHAEKLVKQHHVGGVILFDRNVENPRQVARLNQDLQALALNNGAEIPLFVTIDQEGGRVSRFQQGATLFPGNMALGATREPSLAYQTGKEMGMELRAMGINLDMAPVLDVNNNPQNPVIGVRSFGENPHLVSQMGTEMIRGFHDAGVLTVLKHFPGHGDTSVDSHVGLPKVSHRRERLDKLELVPFKRAIAGGTDMVMSAHVVFPAIEPTPSLPATLSHRVLTDLLRKELKFDGVITTDDMEMGAIAEHFGTSRAAVKAIQAGADIVLVCHRLDVQEQTIAAVKKAVTSGQISEERIDQSVRRILKLKAKKVGNVSVATHYQSELAGSQPFGTRAQAEAVARETAKRAVTLIRDKRKRLPLTPTKTGRLLVITANKPQTFKEVCAQAGYQVEVARVEDWSQAPSPELLAKATQADAILIGMSRLQDKQLALIQQLEKKQKLVIVMGMDVPYDVVKLPPDTAFLALYGSTRPSIEAGVGVMAGKFSSGGRLPVTVSNTFPYGFSAGDDGGGT